MVLQGGGGGSSQPSSSAKKATPATNKTATNKDRDDGQGNAPIVIGKHADDRVPPHRADVADLMVSSSMSSDSTDDDVKP